MESEIINWYIGKIESEKVYPFNSAYQIYNSAKGILYEINERPLKDLKLESGEIIFWILKCSFETIQKINTKYPEIIFTQLNN